MGEEFLGIVTRNGDDGTTVLGDGRRVSKADPRVAALGNVDELNSVIGMLIAVSAPGDELGISALLAGIQQDLFCLGAELSLYRSTLLKVERLAALETWLEAANARLPRLKEFIYPGGTVAGSQAHVCRTVCRRAERAVVELGQIEAVSNTARQYLNRLSDLFFVMARVMNRGREEAKF